MNKRPSTLRQKLKITLALFSLFALQCTSPQPTAQPTKVVVTINAGGTKDQSSSPPASPRKPSQQEMEDTWKQLQETGDQKCYRLFQTKNCMNFVNQTCPGSNTERVFYANGGTFHWFVLSNCLQSREDTSLSAERSVCEQIAEQGKDFYSNKDGGQDRFFNAARQGKVDEFQQKEFCLNGSGL